MKFLLVFAAVLATYGTAAGAEFSTADHPSYTATLAGERLDLLITQNLNTTLIEPVQIACGVSGVYTTQNWYLRRFYLAEDHGITGYVQFLSVAFGVEQLDMADGSEPLPYDLVVRLYRIDHAAAFTFANLDPLNNATVTVTGGDVGTFLNVNVFGSINDAAAQDLVVAIDAPDASAIGAGLQFRPGANSFGATWDAYIAAVQCGIDEPVGVSDIGFPDSQTILVVWALPGGIVPITTTTFSQVKALYR